MPDTIHLVCLVLFAPSLVHQLGEEVEPRSDLRLSRRSWVDWGASRETPFFLYLGQGQGTPAQATHRDRVAPLPLGIGPLAAEPVAVAGRGTAPEPIVQRAVAEVSPLTARLLLRAIRAVCLGIDQRPAIPTRSPRPRRRLGPHNTVPQPIVPLYNEASARLLTGAEPLATLPRRCPYLTATRVLPDGDLGTYLAETSFLLV